MAKIPTYFTSRCPICGRTLQIPAHLLGELLSCEQCGANFVAQDRKVEKADTPDLESEIMQRTDLILSVVRKQRARGPGAVDSAEGFDDGGNRHREAVNSLIMDKGRYKHIGS